MPELAEVTRMPNHRIAPNTPERFPDDFKIEAIPPHNNSAEENLYLGKNDDLLQRRAADAVKLKAYDLSEQARARAQTLGDAFVVKLKEIATGFVDGKYDAGGALARACESRGRYLADIDRLPGKLFVVRVIEDGPDAIGKKYAVDLTIRLRSGLPPPHAAPSAEKQRLFVLIDAAMTVFRTVCQPPEIRDDGYIRRWLRRIRDGEPDAKRMRHLLDEQVRKLEGIATLGLVESHTDIALLALEGMKQEFVAREGGRIKNGYLRSLGWAAGIAIGIFMAAYVAIESDWMTWSWAQRHQSFLLAGAGASLGTWLSFSIRRVQLPFEQLGVIEDDLLSPNLRIFFVTGLTLAAFLLFWTGALSVEIGNLQVNPVGFERAGSIALLLGIFCGLSERALANAISGRAEAFVGGISGAR